MMMANLVQVFSHVLLPVFIIVALGALLQRWQPMHLKTLVILNLYLFAPVYLFCRVSSSQLSWLDIGRIGLVIVLPMLVLAIPLLAALRTMRVRASRTATILVGGLFFNAGNYGVPVAELTFGPAGGRVQALVVMFMSLVVFMVGYTILAMGEGRGVRSVLGFFKLPYIYALVAALVVRDTGVTLPTWLDDSLSRVADALVPVALVTLGAQLANRAAWPRWNLTAPVLLVKLILLPATTAVAVWLLGMWPWPGALLILAASGPTAVNTLLLALEVDGDADAAADCVFWTTLCCAVTAPVVIAILQWQLGDFVPPQ